MQKQARFVRKSRKILEFVEKMQIEDSAPRFTAKPKKANITTNLTNILAKIS
jgi:hypothetical protein